MLTLPVPKNLRSFLCITLMWLCHPQPAVWAWQSGHLESSALTAATAPQATWGTPGPQPQLPDIPDAEELDLPRAQPMPAPGRNTVPVHIEAREQHKDGAVYTLLGDAEVHYGDYVLRADKLNYNQETGEVRAEGHLQLDGGPADEHILADHATLNLDLDTGRFYNVTGSVGVRGNLNRRKVIYTTPNPFLFTGRVVIKRGPQEFRVLGGTMTSCRLPNPDWVISAGRIDLANGQASAHNALFRILNIPIIYLPYVTHPALSSDRQSGLLIPVYSQSSTKGTVIGEQAYLVLNRSADLTLGTDYFSRRGWAPSGELRYRGAGFNFADLRFTALFDRGIQIGNAIQNQGGQDILLNGRYALNPQTRLAANAEYLSSIVYREAFAESFAQATASQVNSNIYITHNDHGFSQTGSFARYINYATVLPVTDVVIGHLPSISADSVEHALAGTPLDWSLEGSAAGLDRHEPGFRTAQEVGRFDVHPVLSLPLHFGGADVRPSVGVRETFYSKSQAPRLILDPLTQTFVPVYRSASLNRKDVEASLELRAPVIERDFTPAWLAHFDRELRHTIEAEAHYSFVSGIDNFRNILRFDPTDLASDTNEVEYSVTQRFYFKRLHASSTCSNAVDPQPINGRVYLPVDYRDCTSSDTTESITWTLAQKRFFDRGFGGALFDDRRNVLATTLDLTGISFLSTPRDYSPLISRLALRTNHLVDLGWDLDYDPVAGRINGSNVYGDVRKGNLFASISHARLDTLNAITRPIPVTNYEQLRATLGYGSAVKPGFSGALNLGYDLNRDELQYGGAQASYNFNCCGLTVEYRRLALGSVRNENYESFNFTLAGIGTAGNINRSQLIY
jgi:LPS-assembly protein